MGGGFRSRVRELACFSFVVFKDALRPPSHPVPIFAPTQARSLAARKQPRRRRNRCTLVLGSKDFWTSRLPLVRWSSAFHGRSSFWAVSMSACSRTRLSASLRNWPRSGGLSYAYLLSNKGPSALQ